MKRYALLLILVLIGSTTAWGGPFNGIPGAFTCPNPCFAPPSPCYTPPTPCFVPPMPCPTPKPYPTPCPPKPVDVSYGSVTSSQNAVLCGDGLAFALHCGGVILWNKGGCGGPSIPGIPGGPQFPVFGP